MVEAYTQIFCTNNDSLFCFPVNKDEKELPKRSTSSLIFTQLPQHCSALCRHLQQEEIDWERSRTQGSPVGKTLGSESGTFKADIGLLLCQILWSSAEAGWKTILPGGTILC